MAFAGELMRLVGYADAWTVRPGDRVGLHASSRTQRVDVSIIRLRHGDDNPAGPGFLATPVESHVSGSYPASWHDVKSGSWIEVESAGDLLSGASFTFAVWICPTKLSDRAQCVISRGDFSVEIDPDGRPSVLLGTTRLTAPEPVALREWYFLAVRFDRASQTLDLVVRPRNSWPNRVEASGASIKAKADAKVAGPLLMAARLRDAETDDHFNGKLDSPTIYGTLLANDDIDALAQDKTPAGAIACWEFSGDQTALEVLSQCGLYRARLIGMPTRAVTGRRACGQALRPSDQPDHYSAVHFHEDDKHDAAWPTMLTLEVPKDWPSAIYAFHLTTADGEEDFVPFFVLPVKDQARADIAFLVPTFSYLAYGNAHHSHSGESVPEVMAVLRTSVEPYQVYVHEQKLGSTYDEHSDGSGVAYVSRLLPQVNVRPKQIGANLAAHQFNADLHMIDWLHAKAFAHDILTDEALHHEGLPLLSPYRVLITGTHPEYWSGQMLDALEAFLGQGGRVMYMGGNGFYWVTSVHPNAPHVLEIRKYAGTRTWTTEPDERHHSTTGEQGGIWRDRARAPNKIVGVGFAGQGYGSNGLYRRTKASFEGPLAKLFEGIEGDVFGDIPSLIWERGVAGFEVDRIDYKLGSPPNTICLASSFDHGELYQLVYEEAMAFMVPRQLTDDNPQLRGDISYLEYPHGGAVFSTGSITFCAALSYNNYENDASRLIENVVRHFLD